jgi:hypothetical protein
MGCPHLVAYARVALARFSLLHSLQPADSQLAPDLDAAASAEQASASATTAVEVRGLLLRLAPCAWASAVAGPPLPVA